MRFKSPWRKLRLSVGKESVLTLCAFIATAWQERLISIKNEIDECLLGMV